MQTTVPKVFSFLSLREKFHLNSSEQEASEASFVNEIDQIYATTKEAIVNRDTTIRAAILTEQSSADPKDITLQNDIQEQNEPRDERVTRSKSKTNVSVDQQTVASNSKENPL